MIFSESNPHPSDRGCAVIDYEPCLRSAVDLGSMRQHRKETMHLRRAVQERGAARLVEVLRAVLEFGERFLGRVEHNTIRVDDTYVVIDKFSAAEYLRRTLIESYDPHRRAMISVRHHFASDKKNQEGLSADGEVYLAALNSTQYLYEVFDSLCIKAGWRIDGDLVDDLAQSLGVLRGFMQELEHRALRDEIGRFLPADVLHRKHGISRYQLSRAKKKGLVDFKQAPEGFPNTEGRAQRILYNKNDALKHCSPRQTKKHADGVVIRDLEE